MVQGVGFEGCGSGLRVWDFRVQSEGSLKQTCESPVRSFRRAGPDVVKIGAHYPQNSGVPVTFLCIVGPKLPPYRT